MAKVNLKVHHRGADGALRYLSCSSHSHPQLDLSSVRAISRISQCLVGHPRLLRWNKKNRTVECQLACAVSNIIAWAVSAQIALLSEETSLSMQGLFGVKKCKAMNMLRQSGLIQIMVNTW